MNVRHDVLEEQDKHRKRNQILRMKPNGQQLKPDWVGQERKETEANNDNSTWPSSMDNDDVGGPEHAWIPPLKKRVRESL